METVPLGKTLAPAVLQAAITKQLREGSETLCGLSGVPLSPLSSISSLSPLWLPQVFPSAHGEAAVGPVSVLVHTNNPKVAF